MVDVGVLDQLIREGRLRESKNILRRMRISEVARPSASRIANLARRSGLSQISVRLLNPIVRPDRNLARPASEAELAEYAAALTNIGARNEGLEILKSLKAEKNPDILLFLAFNYFSVWDYASAIPHLKTYIAVQKVPYQKTVGRVNLAAALVHESEVNEAEKLIERLLEETSGKEFARLHANVLELRAQLMIEKDKPREAEKSLDQASLILKEAGALDDFFVMKWKTLLSVQGTPTKEKIEALTHLKSEALSLHHWETMRDADYYRARLTKDRELFTHLYHGTPHESFRKRILKAAGGADQIEGTFDWKIYENKSAAAVLDVASGEVLGKSKLKSGQLTHRLLLALTSDFYRPSRTATLFSKLFEGEYYNPQSSPHRVHQNVVRLREWFDIHKLPLSVEASKFGYRLTAHKPISIRKKVSAPQTRLEIMSARLKEVFREKEFTVEEFVERLSLSKRSAQRLLSEIKEAGRIESIGGGRSTRYRVTS